MALVLGTNSGFVTVAPTTDPAATAVAVDGLAFVTKSTSPVNAVRIIEIGWWRASGTDTANWEVGLYSEAAGVADALLQVERTNSSSATGWITRSVSWPISPSTPYWLGLQMDAHAGSSNINQTSTGGAGRDGYSATTLANPFGGGAVASATGMLGIYALVERVSVGGIRGATSIISGVF